MRRANAEASFATGGSRTIDGKGAFDSHIESTAREPIGRVRGASTIRNACKLR